VAKKWLIQNRVSEARAPLQNSKRVFTAQTYQKIKAGPERPAFSLEEFE
jgi:hypothetical protein